MASTLDNRDQGPARAGPLVGQAARLEPAVHARLTDLEPPSRFGLAASTANKLHHAVGVNLVNISSHRIAHVVHP